eukprot:9558402-Alexandrium_andersonii.AAC.1
MGAADSPVPPPTAGAVLGCPPSVPPSVPGALALPPPLAEAAAPLEGRGKLISFTTSASFYFR